MEGEVSELYEILRPVIYVIRSSSADLLRTSHKPHGYKMLHCGKMLCLGKRMIMKGRLHFLGGWQS